LTIASPAGYNAANKCNTRWFPAFPLQEGETMQHEIGTAAGKVFRFLDKNKGTPLPVSKLRAGADVKGPLFDQAIGWLAREEKLRFERKRNGVMISLK
jgi:hypothetical protein